MITKDQLANMTDEQKKQLNDSLDKALGNMAPEGWEYQDFPQMLQSYWEYILKAFGEEGIDYKKITEARYKHEDGVYMRGQLLLGPNARKNLGEYIKIHPIPGKSVN